MQKPTASKSNSFDLRNVIRSKRLSRLQEEMCNEVPKLPYENTSRNYQRRRTAGYRRTYNTSIKMDQENSQGKVPNCKRMWKPFSRNNQDKIVRFNASQRSKRNAVSNIRRVIHDSSETTVRTNGKSSTNSQAIVSVRNDQDVIINTTYKWQKKTISSDTKGNQHSSLENNFPVSTSQRIVTYKLFLLQSQ